MDDDHETHLAAHREALRLNPPPLPRPKRFSSAWWRWKLRHPTRPVPAMTWGELMGVMNAHIDALSGVHPVNRGQVGDDA